MTDENDRARVTYPADFAPPLTEARARELIRASGVYYMWYRDPPSVTIDGNFEDLETLEAFAWWLRNRPNEEP